MASRLKAGGDRRRIFRKIILSLGHRNMAEVYAHCFYSDGGAPTSTGTRYVKTGSLAFDLTNSVPYICSQGSGPGCSTATVWKKLVT
jgi:hypothetical protein